MRYKTSPNATFRSLIQKAVRRGEANLVGEIVDHLYEIGDGTWLKARTGVIIAEECYPLMGACSISSPIHAHAEIRNILTQAARSKKFKDATGLGTFALALSSGDNSVLNGSKGDVEIKIVKAAIERPLDFWEWAADESLTDKQIDFVYFAEKAHKKANWAWDKAFIQASAYLALTYGIPEIPYAKKSKETSFPFWVALDKHTPDGKRVINEMSKNGYSWKQLSRISFYCETANVDDLAPSPWWEREIEWKLKKVGLSRSQAEKMWKKARPEFILALEEETELLESHF